MSYPADPATLFIELYDELPEEVFLRPDPGRWKRDLWVNLHAGCVRDQILELGVADPSQIERIVEEGGERGIFTVLRGIDWALEIVNPFGPNFCYGRLAGLVTRYADTGMLNDDKATDGALLPRCSYPGRPQGTRSKALHFGLHRVPPEPWEKIQYKRLESRYDPSYFRPGQLVKVGCAPLLETFADVQLKPVERDGQFMYRLAPVESSSLHERISNVIGKLDDSGAGIGMIPEGALTDKLLDHWEQEAARTAARGKRLRWLLVGSGPLGADDPPPNRAVLLDRLTGHEIISQDKLAGFTMTSDQANFWKLPDRPANGPVAEDIRRGTKVAVLETSLGRFAILICEDLEESIEWDRELMACGISHLLVPIFSKPIINFRWEQQASERAIRNMGTWLIIANSLVVQRAIGEPQNGERWYTCLVAGPGDPDRLNYQYDLQFGTAEAGDDLGLLDETSTLPVIHAGQFYKAWLGNSSQPDVT